MQERIFECISYKCFIFHKTLSKAKIKFSQCRCRDADAEISKGPNALKTVQKSRILNTQ